MSPMKLDRYNVRVGSIVSFLAPDPYQEYDEDGTRYFVRCGMVVGWTVDRHYHRAAYRVQVGPDAERETVEVPVASILSEHRMSEEYVHPRIKGLPIRLDLIGAAFHATGEPLFDTSAECEYRRLVWGEVQAEELDEDEGNRPSWADCPHYVVAHKGRAIKVAVGDEWAGDCKWYLYRNTCGIVGAVLARSWESAYEAVVDEFLHEADCECPKVVCHGGDGVKRDPREEVDPDCPIHGVEDSADWPGEGFAVTSDGRVVKYDVGAEALDEIEGSGPVSRRLRLSEDIVVEIFRVASE